jgi:hypothetical protein
MPRELHLAVAGRRFPFPDHLQLHPNDVSPDTVAAIYMLPMEALPSYLQMSTYEHLQCVAGQCVGFIQNAAGTNLPLPVDPASDFRFVGAYFGLGNDSRKPSAATDVHTVLHEYAHYLDGLIPWHKSELQPHIGSVDTVGFYALSYDLSLHGKPGDSYPCYPKRTTDPKDWITKYGFLTSAYGCAAGTVSVLEEWPEAFSMYVAAGRDFRAAAQQNATIAQKYEWLRTHVFGGIEYDTDLPRSLDSGCNDVYGTSAAQPGYAHCNDAYVWDYTLPTVARSRYFAEGAATAFFKTSFALANPGIATAHVTMKFLKDTGANLEYTLVVPPGSRRTVEAADVPGLAPATGFSTILESDAPVLADRTLSWDQTGYGAHAETSIEAPAQTWYLAEGSTLRLPRGDGTTAAFNLYYLIMNPNDAPADVRITYLRPSPNPPIVRTYTVDALSRRTIWVAGQDPGLASTDVSGVVASLDAARPIIVERALYLDAGGQFFGAGHDAAGVTAPAADWFLAEGATGPAFDEYVLIANPGAAAAELDVTYLLPGGATLSKHYTVAASSRRTIWVNGESDGVVSLQRASVSTRVHSANGVPVIVERAMWWPAPGWQSWYESHCSAGATTTGVEWGMADGEQGGARNTQTYILVANTSAFPGRVRVTLLFEDGTRVARDMDVPATSRTTVWTGGTQQTAESPFGGSTAGRRFGAEVESLDVAGQAAQIVVERAMYWDAHGQWWAAGTNVVGTKLR